MPIKQDRLVALINAADDYKSALEAISDLAKSIRKGIESGRVSLEDISFQLTPFIDINYNLEHPVESAEAIATERAWVKHCYRDNVRRKQKAEQQRRDAGVPQLQSAEFPTVLGQAAKAAPLVKVKAITAADLEGADEDLRNELLEMQGLSSGKELPFAPVVARESVSPAGPAYVDPLNDAERVDQEIELASSASPHAARFPTGSSRTVYCECGWRGAFGQWLQEHRAEANEGKEPGTGE